MANPFARRGQERAASLGSIISERMGRTGNVRRIDSNEALRQSAVWAAIRLRADMVSTMSLGVFRDVNGQRVAVPKPPVFTNPDGKGMHLTEWLYSTQVDLDRVGNCYGIITAVDGAGNPAAVELVSHKDVAVVSAKGVISYVIGGQKYDAKDVWHEKQFTVAGLAMGLSPVAYAAWSSGTYASAAEFALDWFVNGGTVPGGHLKNEEQILGDGVADRVKEKFKLSVENRDVFVTGKDWTYTTVNAEKADARFLEMMQASDRAAVRYYGVPGDLIDVNAEGSSVTYANITQRNLQFLIINLNPAITRREAAFGRMVGESRYVKFNRSTLLEMDPETSIKVSLSEVAGRMLAPSEYRARYDRPPLTDAQIAEFDKLGLDKAKTASNGAPANG